MQRVLIISAIAIVIIGLVVWIGIMVFAPEPQTPPGGQNPFPTSSTTPSQGGTQTVPVVTVASVSGAPIQTRDFKKDPNVITNPYNTQGYYILAGTNDPAAPNPPYEINYSDKDQSFGITLYKEPLGQYRLQAEQDLKQRLGISSVDMCRLVYFLAVGPGVNQAYNGKNLGFSFCPGATPLPQ